MPKNKISDLRNLMMETIERLMDPDDPMDAKKAVAISQLGNVIVNSAKTELQAARLFGNQNPSFFQDGQQPVKQIAAPVRSDLEVPDCKCGKPIYPVDLERSEALHLDYPRCSECLNLLPENSNDLNGGGK
jgi:hypothetical protein